MLQLGAKSGCTLICGKSGSGKTTFALRWLVTRRDLVCRFIFQEPKRDIVQRLGLNDSEDPDELACAVEDGFCIYYPGKMFPGNWAAGLNWFCEWSYGVASRMPGRKLLMVDECWKYCSPHQIPRALAQWLQDGRSWGCETLFATQRPNKLNEAITNEATEIVCFRLQGRNALELIADHGLDGDEVGRLPLGSFVALNCESGGELRGRLW